MLWEIIGRRNTPLLQTTAEKYTTDVKLEIINIINPDMVGLQVGCIQ